MPIYSSREKRIGLHAVADSVTLAFERHPLPAFAALAILVTQRKSLKGIAPKFCHCPAI
jgi:hypothetical protein